MGKEHVAWAASRRARNEAGKRRKAVALVKADREKQRRQTRNAAMCGLPLPFWSNELGEHAAWEQSQEPQDEKTSRNPKSANESQPTTLSAHVNCGPFHTPCHLLSPPYLGCPLYSLPHPPSTIQPFCPTHSLSKHPGTLPRASTPQSV